MANAFVQQKTEQSTTNVTSFTTSAMTVTAGNAVAVASCANNYAVTLTITDSVGDAFARQIDADESISQRVQWDLATNVVGGSTTFTVTSSLSKFLSIAVHEYSG